MPRWLKITLVLFAVLAVLITAGSFAIARVPALKAGVITPLAFLNIMVQQGAWRPLQILTPQPELETHAIESSSGRKLETRVWVPRALWQNRFPATVIYTPFIGGGLEDPRLVNLASTFARAGIVSLAFWRSGDPLVASEKDIADVVSAFRFLAEHPAVRPEAVGLVGISYGAGPVMLAAADPRIRGDVRFIVSHAGYYDLENVLRFIVAGEYGYGEIRGKLEPNRYGHEILSRTLEHLGVDDATAKAFTETPENFDENLAELPELRELARRLSPAEVIAELRAERLYILHAANDAFIPYTESLRLRDALSNRLPVRFQLIDVFEHGTPRPPTLENLRRYWIPNFTKSLTFLYTLLRETYE